MRTPPLPLLAAVVACSLVACNNEDHDLPQTFKPPTVGKPELAGVARPDGVRGGAPLAVLACQEDFSDKKRSHLDVSVDGGKEVGCSSFHGARAKMTLRAPAGATLTVGAVKTTVPAKGEVDVTVELAEPILALALDDFAISGANAKVPPLVVPYALDAAGKHVSGQLSFSEPAFEQAKMFHAWLHDLADDKIDRPAFKAPAPGDRKTLLYLNAIDNVTATDRRGSVRDLTYVATISETGRHRAGMCTLDVDGERRTIRRLGVDSVVTVVALADGKVAATKAFPAPEGCPLTTTLDDPNNPEVAVIVRTDDVMKWLETLTRS